MHIHLGNDISVAAENVIGIFDIENSSANKDTRNFLRKAEKIGTVVTVSYDMPKSFVVCIGSNACFAVPAAIWF